MTIEDVLHDRKPETRTAALAAAFDIDAIDTLGQPRDRFARDAFAFVLDGDEDLPALASASRLDAAELHPHGAFFATVFDRVVDQILEDLRKLVAVADDKH